MIRTGMIKNCDKLGRLVIPRSIAKSLNLLEDRLVSISIAPDGLIVIKPVTDTAEIAITRRIDMLNRVVIPKDVRNQLDIGKDTPLEVIIDESENAVCLRRSADSCVICGEYNNLYNVKGRKICDSCITFIQESM